ncbi:MAG: hypothetical protein ACYCWW_19580 [Deltaproteobacteria bacterium]
MDAGFLAYDPFAAARCLGGEPTLCLVSAPLLSVVSIPGMLLERCPGVLAPRSGVGQVCLDWSDCDGGVCAFGPGCTGSCVSYLSAGAACSPTGIPCDVDLQCRAGQCRAGWPSVGSPCTSPDDCSSWGLWCSLDAGVCQPLAAEGQGCQAEGGLWAPPCRAPDWCDVSDDGGTCAAPSGDGGPCSVADGLSCVMPFVCHLADAGPTLGRCRSPSGEGGACDVFDCESGLICHQGRCVPLPDAGAPCISFPPSVGGFSFTGQCAPPLICGATPGGGYCGARACLGAPCGVGGGACIDGSCLNGRCAVPGPGSPCAMDADCASLDCVDGGCADPYACTP